MDIRILLLPALVAASAASAQGAAPADASRSAAPPYRSAFEGYRAWRDPAPMNWREANETAGALGGHMGHVRGRPPELKKDASTPAKPAGSAK